MRAAERSYEAAIEDQDDILFAIKFRQADNVAVEIRQCEIGGWFVELCFLTHVSFYSIPILAKGFQVNSLMLFILYARHTLITPLSFYLQFNCSPGSKGTVGSFPKLL